MSNLELKPMGIKNYGSIPHIPGSRIGTGEHMLPQGQADIALVKTRDKNDIVWCQEKLDGSNVGIYRKGNEVFPLIRSGHIANSSPYEQHHKFYNWAMKNQNRFLENIDDGCRLCGEWLYQPHGTLYNLPHEPFVLFDYMTGAKRTPWEHMIYLFERRFQLPATISGVTSIEKAWAFFGEKGKHGALEKIEGFVWRVERRIPAKVNEDCDGLSVDFLCKYVRPDKVDGKYLKNKFVGEI